MAASTSISRASSTGLSVGWRLIDQKSGVSGSNTRVRNWSSARSRSASARITASMFRATSFSAETMSIGAMVPTSTRVRLLRSDSSARASDWRWTSRNELAYTSCQYALRTVRSVETTVRRRSMSERSRLARLPAI